MFTPGDYKMATMKAMNEEELKFESVDIQVLIDRTEDEDDKEDFIRQANVILRVSDEGVCTYLSPIPDSVPKEEIDKAIEAGEKVIDGKYLVTQETEGKVENGELFIYDDNKMLTGEEWVKVSTDDPEILDFIMATYKKI